MSSSSNIDYYFIHTSIAFNLRPIIIVKQFYSNLERHSDRDLGIMASPSPTWSRMGYSIEYLSGLVLPLIASFQVWSPKCLDTYQSISKSNCWWLRKGYL